MSTIDMILYQKGPDDGEGTKFYTFVVDQKNPDRYPRNDIVDRFNNITWDKFLEIDKLACKYEGPKDGFMREFRNLFIC